MLNYLGENEVIDEDHSALWKWTTSETFVWIETLKNVRVDFFFICNKTEDFFLWIFVIKLGFTKEGGGWNLPTLIDRSISADQPNYLPILFKTF